MSGQRYTNEELMARSTHHAPFFSFKPGSDSGTTAVVALIRGKQLIVANAGDSRCVVSEAGKALDMSYDHKPEDEVELARIKNAGGKVTMDGRVNWGLNLSRAIGKGQEAMGKTSRVLFPVPDYLVAKTLIFIALISFKVLSYLLPLSLKFSVK